MVPTWLPKRISIPLDPADALALSALSEREDRDPRIQALRLVREGLRREGVLPPPDTDTTDREPELVAQ